MNTFTSRCRQNTTSNSVAKDFGFSWLKQAFVLLALLMVSSGVWGQTNWYTLASGKWTDTQIWTLDPAGAVPVNPSNLYPNLTTDNIVIRTGITVTIPDGLAPFDLPVAETKNNLNCGSLTVNGDLDFGVSRGHQFTAIKGDGRIYFESNNFPSADWSNFVTSGLGGGTVVIRGATGFTLTSLPATLYDLEINNSVSTTIYSLDQNLTLNGSLTVESGVFQVGTTTTARSLTVGENVNIKSNGILTTATTGGAVFHWLNVGGNFTNAGVVDFSNSAQYVQSTNGAVKLKFTGATDNTFVCNGTTDLYRLFVDKGADQTFSVAVSASSSSNFNLFGPVSGATSDAADGAYGWQKLPIVLVNGTLKLESNIVIPRLGENITGTAPGAFTIPSTAQFWVNGGNVTTSTITGDYTGIYVYGKLKVSNGTLTTPAGTDGIRFLTENGITPVVDIAGGNIYATTLSPKGAVDKFQFIQTDGTLYFNNRETNHWDNPLLNLNNAAHIFNMSGGTMSFSVASTFGVSGIYITSSDGNYNVTGGNVVVNTPSTNDFRICSTAPFYNLTVSGTGSAYKVTQTELYGGTDTFFYGELSVLNDFIVSNNGSFDSQPFNLSVGGNMTIGLGSSFTQTAGTTAKLTFNGAKNSILTNQNTTALALGDLEIDKNIYSPSTQFYTVSLAGSTGGITINDSLRIIRGKLDVVNYNINLKKSLEITDGDLTSSGTGSIILSGTTQQTIRGAEGAEQNFGRLQLNNTASAPQIKLLSNVNATSVTFLRNQVFDLDIYNLDISIANYTTSPFTDNTTDPITVGVWGTSCMFKTSGKTSDGGLTLPVVLNANYGTDTNVQVFPVGTMVGTTSTLGYDPASVFAKGTLNISGKVTVKPVNNDHPTVTTSGSGVIPYYWKVSYSGLAGITAANLRYQFQYSGTISSSLNKGTVLSNYVWNDVGTVTGTSNPVVNFQYKTGTGKDDGFIVGDYTIGNKAAFNSPRVLYSITNGAFASASTWSVTSHTGTATNKAPTAYDFCIIGGAGVSNHTVTIPANNADASQVYIKGISETGISGTPPTLKVASGTTGHDIDIIDGKGKLVFEDNSGAWSIANLINGDYSSFCNNSESIFEYAGTTGYRIAPVSTIPYYPNLHISGNTSNTKYSRNDGDLIVKGDLYINDGLFAIDSYYNGLVTIGDSLKINTGTLTLSNQSTQNTYVENSIVFSGAGTLKTGDSGSENKLYLKGNITLINGSTLDFSSISRKTNVVFYGDNSATVSRTGSGTTNFYRTYIDKPIGKNVQFTTNFSLNGPTTDATKALVLQSGECYLNNSAINIALSTGGNPFKIPAGTTLRVDNGARVNAGGSGSNTGIWLDGSLIVDNGGKVYCNQGTSGYTDNYIEYTPSGSSYLWLGTNAELLVGSQLRRTTTSGAGVLRFVQAKSSSIVTLGINSAPTANRGVFEVLNSGSSFKQLESGSVISIVRGQTSASSPTLYFNPDTVSLATGSSFVMGTAATPVSNSMGVYSGKTLQNLTIGANAVVSTKIDELLIGGDLLINGSLHATGFDLLLNGNFTNNGVYTPAGNLTHLYGVADQSVGGTSSTSFFDFTKSGSNTLTLTSNSVTVSNDLTIGVEKSGDLGGILNTGSFDVNVARNVIVYGTTLSSGSSKGIVCNGTSLQELRGKATIARLTINNSLGLDLPTQSMPINFTDYLHLENGVFNIGKNSITLDNDAVITAAGAFSSSRMVQTNLSFTDNGIKKTLPSGTWDALTPFTFVYPIGSAGKYTPVTLKVTQNGNSTGTVRVKAANEKHISIQNDPLTTIDETKNVLQYNWTLDANGVSGFTGVAQMDFIGSDALVTGTNLLSQYITARILLNSTSWNKFDANDFDEVANTMIFKYSGTGDSGIDGDYTAGIKSCIPDNVPSYISIANSDWTDVNTWALYTPSTNTIGAAGVGVPAGGPRGSVVYINTTVTMPTNFLAAYRTNINSSGVLSTGASFGHRLGDVDGTGTLKLESGNLPAGVYDHFFSAAGGTLEYTGTSDYSILSDITSLNNLKLSGSCQRNFPNIGFSILGDFSITGGNSLNPHNTNYAVGGDILFTGGSFNSNTATVTLNGTSKQTISGTSNFTSTNTFYNLLINNGSGVDILNGVEVANVLTLTNGVVNTDAGSLTITNTSTAAFTGGSTSSFVDGPLRKQISNSSSFDFPVGDNGRYGLFKVATNTSSQGIWEVKYFNKASASDGFTAMQSPVVYVSANEYWSVKAPNTSCIADLTARWDDASGVNPDDATSLLVKYVETPLGWTQTTSIFTGTIASGTATTAAATFTSFSGVNRITFGANSIPAYTWDGSYSSDWFTAANWSNNIVPSASSNTSIANVTNKPVISGSTVAQTNNLTLQTGATLTINAGGKMTVNGNLSIADANSLIVKNTPASMASLITNGTISGTTRVETTMPLGNRYWYYGFSVNGAGVTSGVWNATDIVNTWAYKANTTAYVRFIDNVTALGSNPHSGLLNGYSVKLLGTGNTTLVVQGSLNNGNLSTTLPNNSWNLMCNPYPSSLDMSIVYANNVADYGTGKVDPMMWVPTNESGSTVQRTYNFATSIGTNGGTKILPPTQGFWLRNTNTGTQNFTVNQAARLHSATALKSLSTPIEEDLFRFELVGATMSDEMVVGFRDIGSVGVTMHDSEKRLNSGTSSCNIYSVKATKGLAVNLLPLMGVDTVVVPLSVNAGTAAAGNYSVRATNLATFDSSIDVYFVDILNDITIDLRQVNVVSLNLSAGTVNNRYVLKFAPSSTGVATTLPDFKAGADENEVVIRQQENDVLVTIPGEIEPKATIELYGIEGQLIRVKKQLEKVTRIHLPNDNNIYVVRVTNNGKVKSAKVVSMGR